MAQFDQPVAGIADEAIPLEAPSLRAREGPSRGPDIDFGEVDFIPLILDQGAVDELVEKYGIPHQFKARAAQPGEVACRPPHGFVAIYKDQLIAGLHLPIPQFLFQILIFWGIRVT